MVTFKEWLQQNDPAFYSEGFVDWAKRKAMVPALLGSMLGGVATAQAQSPTSEPQTSQSPPASEVPSAQDQQKALAQFNQLFKNELASAKTPQEKSKLSERFLQIASETSDPVSRYMIYNQAKTLAAQAGDATATLNAIDSLAKYYKINTLEAKADAIAKMTISADSVDQVNLLIDEAMRKDNYQIAKALAAKVVSSLQSGKADASTLQEASKKLQSIRESESSYEKIKPSIMKLYNDPSNPKLNGEVGKFYCFIKGDWDHGLPMLSKGDEEITRSLAVMERSATSADEMVKVADGWWGLSESQAGTAKRQIVSHASSWYEKALPELKGVEKIRVEKRLESSSDVKDIASYMVGKWKVAYSNGWKDTWIFHKDGTVSREATPSVILGDWKLEKDCVKLMVRDGTNKHWDAFSFPIKKNVVGFDWQGYTSKAEKIN